MSKSKKPTRFRESYFESLSGGRRRSYRFAGDEYGCEQEG